MNQLKVVAFLLLVLAIGAGLSQFTAISKGWDSTIRGANRGQIEARVRMRCGRGGRCKAGMSHGDSSAIARIQIKEMNPG